MISLVSLLSICGQQDISKCLIICIQVWKCFVQPLRRILYLRNIHRSGQEVWRHITNQDRSFDIRYKVKLHTMNSLISTVIDIRCIWIKIPSAWVGNVWDRKENQRSLETSNFPGMQFYLNMGLQCRPRTILQYKVLIILLSGRHLQRKYTSGFLKFCGEPSLS